MPPKILAPQYFENQVVILVRPMLGYSAMRLLLSILVLLVAAEAIDIVWFDGYYSQAIFQYISQESKDIESQLTAPGASTFIHPPNLSRHWRIP